MLFRTVFPATADVLASWGVGISWIPAATTAAVAIMALCACILIYLILAYPVSKVINYYVDKTETKTDDILLSPAIVRGLCRVALAFIVRYIAPRLCYYYPSAVDPVARIASLVVIISVAAVLILEINGFCLFLRTTGKKGGVLVIRNILQTVVYVIAALVAISTILGKEIAYIVSAIGAMAAVLMLVFKDSILGMIAGIRLTLNGMLKENDWITVPAYNADGRVEDVSLTAVKIRNWDKSIATVPPYALVSEGFINHESMLELGLRQIRRAIYIDVTSLRILEPEKIARILEETPFPCPEDTRVNIALFRRYVRHILENHPRRASRHDHHVLQLMVRELPATQSGIPLEIFFFVDCTDWEEFEELQADLLDFIMASAPRFELRIFQHISTLPPN